MLPIMLALCSNMNNINEKFCCLNVLSGYLPYENRSIWFYLCISEHSEYSIRAHGTVQHCTWYFICADCSIREYQSDCSPLCWHNNIMFSYYALNYAGIFDGGLIVKLRTTIIILPSADICNTVSQYLKHHILSKTKAQYSLLY